MKQILLVVVALCFTASPLLAFHDGGVAHCNGCHTMHNSQDGALVDPLNANGNLYLLNKADASAVCIECHDHLDRTFPIGGDPLAPPNQTGGGNFIFLIEDNLNDGHDGALHPITGDAAGHNLVATEYGLSADGTLTQSPGGSFPAGAMGCTACHDPHGTTDFRFLYGSGRGPAGQAAFTAPAPVADGITIFAGESNSFHTAYKSGMSDWCGNCHGDYHNNGAKLIHPSGVTLGVIANVYNAYAGSDSLTGEVASNAYLTQVPFEDPANISFSAQGPSPTSQVSCITCHRAHASSAPDAGRWDFSITHLEEDGLESGSYKIPNPYSVYQRSLCNKCHKKDEFDLLIDGTTK